VVSGVGVNLNYVVYFELVYLCIGFNCVISIEDGIEDIWN